MPLLVAFMKIQHRTSMLTAHLIDMRNYMPAEHRALIAAVEAMPNIRPIARKQSYNAVLARGYADQHSAWRARGLREPELSLRG
jgi:Indoleamine 2,3-dioxygenase